MLAVDTGEQYLHGEQNAKFTSAATARATALTGTATFKHGRTEPKTENLATDQRQNLRPERRFPLPQSAV
jgi:hypothetical protein